MRRLRRESASRHLAVEMLFDRRLAAGEEHVFSFSIVDDTGGSTPGVTIGTSTAGGAASASDGTQIFAGLLGTESMFTTGSAKTSGALLWFGEVYAAKCPVPFDPDDIAAVAPGVNINYR